jgi:hypothetical protein
MTMLDLWELHSTCRGADESDICQYAADLGWDDLQEALPHLAHYGVSENDIMRWIYFNLK